MSVLIRGGEMSMGRVLARWQRRAKTFHRPVRCRGTMRALPVLSPIYEVR